jgi:hypothetical protein
MKVNLKFKLLSLLLWIVFLATHGLFSYELGIVTMFRNEANYLKEWVEYHHMLGVDHFLLYNDRSEDHWAEVLEPYIRSHLVEVIDWDAPPGTPIFPDWQITAYQDGLKRSKGNTKWLAFIDIDEFILPKKNATILECLDQFFPSASAVYACWRNFGTSKICIPEGEPILTHLILSSHPFHVRNAAGKSIVKVDDVVIDQIWSPHHLVLRKDAQYYNGSGRPLYFKEKDLQVDPYHTSDYIQINHYMLRDENFYHKVRLPRTMSKEYGELHLLLDYYRSFNYIPNYQMIQFLKKKHPIMYQTFWKGQ